MSEVSARALARSSLHVNLAQLWLMASRLVLTPVVIATLGLEGYGAWILICSLCAYATALNTGIVWAYVKLTAELDEQGDYGRLSAAVSSGAVVVAGVTAAGLACLWATHTWVLPRLGVPAALLAETQRGLVVLSAAVLLDATAGCALYVLAGLQRMDLQYQLIVAGSVAEFATSLALLVAGYRLVALAVGVLVGQAVSAGAAWISCRRLRPFLRISPLRAGREGLRELLPLGFRLQSVVVLNTAVRETIRLTISSLFGTAALGIFQLADRLLNVARTPALAVITPLMPAFAHLGAGGHTMQRQRLFSHASKAIAIAAALPLLFAAVFADSILFAWTGTPYREAAWTARVLAPAEVAVLLTGVAVAALRGAGTVALELRFGLLGGVLGLAGIAVGHSLAGYAGSVVAIASTRAAAALWFQLLVPALWRIERWAYVWTVVLAPLAAVVPVVLGAKALAMGLALPLSSPADRWTVLLVLLLLAGFSALGSAAVAWFLLMSPEERATLRRIRPLAMRPADAADPPLE